MSYCYGSNPQAIVLQLCKMYYQYRKYASQFLVPGSEPNSVSPSARSGRDEQKQARKTELERLLQRSPARRVYLRAELF